ncbi:Glycoside hydrolase family 62 protein [Mycena venus]|uniref:Alpha-L-arabinofuranosidase n=1 Tax=Mycena venus TaxID=2733690 RepID=A0A8H6YCK3_9AGAR|nr:Glycoside hydrolase family 62 protein [Mycena venus]
MVIEASHWHAFSKTGWTGPLTCAQGFCAFSNLHSFLLALPTTTNTPVTTVTATTSSADSKRLTQPRRAEDPSIVFYNSAYYVFASTARESGYNLVYLAFTDFNAANSSTYCYLDQITGYRAAPQEFFMAPQNKWYLIYQNGNAAYSTNTDIANPAGWTASKNFYASEPSIIASNIGAGFWVDIHLYRSDTSLANFPNRSRAVIGLSDPSKNNLFEASNVYKVGDEFFIVECIGTDGRRFRLWTSTSLTGIWTTYAATMTNPFAGAANVVFTGTPWTKDISYGEMIRTNVDQTMTISPCNMRYLYQGLSPTVTGDYNSLPRRRALLTATDSPC